MRPLAETARRERDSVRRRHLMSWNGGPLQSAADHQQSSVFGLREQKPCGLAIGAACMEGLCHGCCCLEQTDSRKTSLCLWCSVARGRAIDGPTGPCHRPCFRVQTAYNNSPIHPDGKGRGLCWSVKTVRPGFAFAVGEWEHVKPTACSIGIRRRARLRTHTTPELCSLSMVSTHVHV